jgi:hypothetical protein
MNIFLIDDVMTQILIQSELKMLICFYQTCHHIKNLMTKHFWIIKMENDDLNDLIVYNYPLLENLKSGLLYDFYPTFLSSQEQPFKTYYYLKESKN